MTFNFDPKKKVIAVLEGGSRSGPELGELLKCEQGNREIVSFHRNGLPIMEDKPGHYNCLSNKEILERLAELKPDVVVIEKFFTTPGQEALLIEGIKSASPMSKIAIQGYVYQKLHHIPHVDRVAAIKEGFLLLPSNGKEAANLILGVFGRVKAPSIADQNGLGA